MPAYSSFVTTMTALTKKQRGAGLDSITSMIKHLPKEQQLAVAVEPGLLAAVEPFLRLGGDKASTALDLLSELGKAEREDRVITETARKCKAAIFDSPCLSSIKDMAAMGSTMKLKRKAWRVIVNVTCVDDVLMKAMLDSADMFALLQAGLESKDDKIARSATITTSNLCEIAEVASVLLDSHPDLVKALVNAFSTSGVCTKFECKPQLHPCFLSIYFCFVSFHSNTPRSYNS